MVLQSTEQKGEDQATRTTVITLEIQLSREDDLIDLVFGVYRHFQQYFSYIMATSFSGGRKKPEYPERTTDHGQATGKLYQLRLRVECTLFCNLQIRARTHVVLVIGLYELLGNPTT